MQDELLYRYLKAQATPEESVRVRAWLAASDGNRRHLDELALVMDLLTEDANAPTRTPDPAALIRQAEARRATGRARRGSHSPRRGARAAALVAACVASLALGWLLHTVTSQPADATLVVEEFITGPSERATVRLADGTVVRLAPRTRLEVTGWTADQRNLSLDGRAYFAVAHEPERPFRVSTRAGEVRVLGTRFELNTQETALRVVVVDGQVALEVPRREAVVVQRDEVGLVVNGATSVTHHENAAELVDWMGRFLAFQKTPLPEALNEIEGLYGVRIELTDPALAEQTVTGLFVDRPLEDLLETLSLILNTRWQRDGAVIRVGR